MAVYLDLAVLLNFLVDLFLLLGTNRLAGFGNRWPRVLGAAGLGALYSGLCLLPGLETLGMLPGRILALLLMGLLAFGADRSALRRGAVFLLLSLSLGGMAMGFHRARFGLLLGQAGALTLLCSLAFGERIGGREFVRVAVTGEKETLHMTALVDTGNSLRDPVTGGPVLVISGDCALRLTGLSRAQLESPLETLSQGNISGLRLVPFRTVGGTGLLLARTMEVEQGGRKARTLVAFAPGGLGENEYYQALTGGKL